ncbi:MAG: ABC transporter permease [Saprospiraceae bacterium]
MINQDQVTLYSDSLQIIKKPFKPIFYWSVLPRFTKEEKLDPSSLPLSGILPVFKWNGIHNVYHEWLTQTSYSLRDSKDVSAKVFEAIQWTLVIQIPALILIFILGIYLAEWSVKSKNNNAGIRVTKILTAFHSVPVFWLASLLLIFFTGQGFLHIFPSSFVSADVVSPFEFWTTKIHYIILPLIAIVLPALAVIYNLARNNILSNMEKPFWKRTMSSGLSQNEAIKQEARPLAMIPLIAWIASAIPFLISGSIIIENIFSIPGTGRLLFQSIGFRDWPVVHALFMLASFLTILGIQIAELVQLKLDPRL